MSERSRTASGKVELLPPGQAGGIVCPSCWSKVGFRHDTCWACGHPLVDAFRGHTEVVVDVPAADRTVIAPAPGPFDAPMLTQIAPNPLLSAPPSPAAPEPVEMMMEVMPQWDFFDETTEEILATPDVSLETAQTLSDFPRTDRTMVAPRWDDEPVTQVLAAGPAPIPPRFATARRPLAGADGHED